MGEEENWKVFLLVSFKLLKQLNLRANLIQKSLILYLILTQKKKSRKWERQSFNSSREERGQDHSFQQTVSRMEIISQTFLVLGSNSAISPYILFVRDTSC
ncbi:hypothetical protein ES319_A13G208700v1 [Gossypium barbadense]|uniref:Uncharacterized protein n=2 Tax=Gossypium TaxID=3633 RepID=A0A5J5T5U7_GOSBA|nr:hypothetical protein ES319_A13G208700v1 [Gossypium barbadense]TYG87530.1 hypothetical protein ES288_A13G222600v1 [Gossypium darwinii]